MKRPMLVAGLSFLTVMLIAIEVDVKITAIAGAVSAAAFVMSLLSARVRQAVLPSAVFLSVSAACFFFIIYTNISIEPAVRCCSQHTEVTARIIQIPDSRESNGSYHYLVKTEAIGGKAIRKKMRLTVYKRPPVQLYDQICFTGRVFALGDDEGEYALYYRSNRMYLGAYTGKDIAVRPAEKKPLYYYILRAKQKITATLSEVLPGDNGGLLIALLFGDKSHISAQCMQDMRTAGLSHLMAISGMHLSAWVLLFVALLEKLRVPKRLAAVLGFIPLAAVAMFSAFSTSVLRAGLMMLLTLSGSVLKKRTEGLNSLGFACFVLILFNPYIVADVSFLLSVSATLGVILCAKYILPGVEIVLDAPVAPLRAILLNVARTALISLFAQLFTFPVSVLSFGTVSPYAVVANILVSLPAVISMFGSGVLTFTGFIPFIGSAQTAVLRAFTTYIRRMSGFIAGLPCSTVRADYSYVYISVAALILSAGVLYWLTRKKIKTAVLSLCVFSVVLTAGAVCYGITAKNRVSVRALDTGNGCCVLISQGKQAVLIGCAGDYYTAAKVTDELDRMNVTLTDILLPYEKSYTKAALKSITERNPHAAVLCARGVTAGFEREKTVTAPLSAFRDVKLTVHDGFVHCQAYGTSLLIGKTDGTSADIVITDSGGSYLNGLDGTGLIVQGYRLRSSQNGHFTCENGCAKLHITRNGYRLH